ISTESGIPDFRSPTGLWAQFDPFDYGSIESFRADPARVWHFYALRFEALSRAEPNAAHLALAELERRGLVRAVITQNIDRLHERAGSQNVIEVHGSIRTSSCLSCGERVPFDEVVRALEDAPAPPCPGCGAILKPLPKPLECGKSYFGRIVVHEPVGDCSKYSLESAWTNAYYMARNRIAQLECPSECSPPHEWTSLYSWDCSSASRSARVIVV